ncbi:MAG: trypsin-like peptidase domain-containing protein [Pirellulaceae bacterium]
MNNKLHVAVWLVALLAVPQFSWAQQIPSGLTYVSAPSALAGVLRGEAPKSLAELRALEQQQRSVSQRVAKCTVNVQIGYAQGSGVIITDDGYILTAAHVAMRPGQQAILTLEDGRQVKGTTLGMNRFVDAGLIKIDDTPPDEGWPFATLGTSANVVPGTWCIAVGHPGGYESQRGAVIRIGRVLIKRDTSLVTDCVLIGGDSGGPLFDLNGKLIGVHSRIGNDVTDNLHVPIDHYDEHWTRLANSEIWGHLPGFRPRIGVQGRPLETRAVIDAVGKGSPADEAGIKPGDIIKNFGDVVIADFESLKAAVSDTMPGEHVRVVVERDGVQKRMILVVGRDPNS